MQGARPIFNFILGTKVSKASLFVVALFFFSGFSSLIYQVVWQRLLGYVYGVDVFAVTIVVSAYMLGLGSGNLTGGIVADSISRRRSIVLFAMAELAIAIFALGSKYLIYDLLRSYSPLVNNAAGIAALTFTTLLIPTYCMGMTLPLLSKALTPDLQGAGTTIGSLYAANTIGASLGALFTPVFFIRNFGLPISIAIGASINVIVAICAVAIFYKNWDLESSDNSIIVGAHSHPIKPALLPMPAWLCIYFLSGFMALALELIWFRLLSVVLKSNSFTFAWLLFVYLSGLGLGSLCGLAVARRVRDSAQLFFCLQAAVPIYSGLCPAVLLAVLDHCGFAAPLWRHLDGDSPMAIEAAAHLKPEFVLLYFGACFFLIFLPTLLMGMSFPVLQKIVQSDLSVLGRRVGWLQSANVLGATIGALSVSLLMFNALGTSRSLQVIVGLGSVFLALWWYFQSASANRSEKLIGYAGCISAILFVMASVPDRDMLWAKLHGTTEGHIIVKEGSSGISVLKSATWGAVRLDPVFVFANGLGQSQLPYGSEPIHTNLGMLPAFLHPNPQDIGIIGLGSGDTVFGAAGRKETRSITCIELVDQEMNSLQELNRRHPNRSLEELFGDRRIHFVFTDGRRFIDQHNTLYDILEADPRLPDEAYSGNVYSREFFLLLLQHLKPGGLAVTWYATERTRASFLNVFPYVVQFPEILVGSNRPITFSSEVVLHRAADVFPRAHYGTASIDPGAFLKPLLAKYQQIASKDRVFDDAEMNTDLFPRDEYQRRDSR